MSGPSGVWSLGGASGSRSNSRCRTQVTSSATAAVNRCRRNIKSRQKVPAPPRTLSCYTLGSFSRSPATAASWSAALSCSSSCSTRNSCCFSCSSTTYRSCRRFQSVRPNGPGYGYSSSAALCYRGIIKACTAVLLALWWSSVSRSSRTNRRGSPSPQFTHARARRAAT